MSFEIVEKLKREISRWEERPELESVGVVSEAGDGVAKISGLSKALAQELLVIETSSGEIPALAFNLEEYFIGAVILGDPAAVRVGDRVRKSGRVLSIKVSEELVGRVLDPTGAPLDAKGTLFSDPERAEDCLLERSGPSVVAREPVNAPLHTGIAAIDAMIPIGRGQRELIIGDRQTGKTAIALDAIVNQKQDPARPQVICIYVAIGQKNSKIARTVKFLEDRRALGYTIVVSAPAASPAALQYLAPFAGCAIGEYFMDRGRDALIIYDDLSKHADAYRQLSLLLRRPPGREAYPGDIFYLHSRLLERAAKLDRKHGGGSLSALPIVETKLGDVSAYIPTNVISITDGQIYLESNLFYRGIRPAINVGLSVSRVGSAAQTRAMKKVASRLRLELAQFRELAAFVQFAADLDARTKAQIRRGELLTEILKQSDGEPIPLERQVVALWAALAGHFDRIPTGGVKSAQNSYLEFLDARFRANILEPIAKSGTLDDRTEAALNTAVAEFLNLPTS